MLGFNAIARLALAEAQDAGGVIPLLAGSGSFSLTGEPAAFQIQEASAFGPFALTGEVASFPTRQVSAAAAFVWTVEAAAFEFLFSETEQLSPARNLPGGAALGEFALAQGLQYLGAFPLTFSYALSGQAVNSTDFEILSSGAFALTGEVAHLSWEYLGGGGTIVAGTFSRGRWRALQEELAAERAAERRKNEEEKRRRREAREAAAAAERERRQAERARIDAASASAAAERALADALAAAAHGERTRAAMQHATILHAHAIAAQEKARAQDEEESLALLLAA